MPRGYDRLTSCIQWIRELRTPIRLRQNLESRFPQDSIASIERSIVNWILTTQKYRMMAIYFNSLADEMGSAFQERVGLIQFAGLVGIIDDVMDNCNPIDMNPNALQRTVDSHKITLEDQSLSVRELREMTINKFDPERQASGIQFLNIFLQSFPESLGSIGQYTYEEAKNYRTKTSGGYLRTGAHLAGMTEEHRLTEVEHLGTLWQMLDDAYDCREDIIANRVNLFAGLAFDQGESHQLIDQIRAYEQQMSEPKRFSFELRELLAKRKLTKNVPKTHQKYATIFRGKLQERPIASTSYLRMLGKILIW